MELIDRLKAINRHRELLIELAHKDFDNRYAGSALGVLWTQAYPLLLLTVYMFVFSVVFPTESPYFPLFLFTGIVLWHFFSTCIMLSANSILANASILSRVAFPRELVVISVVLIASVDLVMSHTIILIGALLYGVYPSWTWLAIPFVLALLMLICLGLGLLLATATVYLRDVRFFTEVGVLMLMFLSGVFFSAAQVPASQQWVMNVNPLAVAITAYRGALLDRAWPDPWAWAILAGVAAVTLWFGFRTFDRYEEGFVDAI